jgi:photosystem II protein
MATQRSVATIRVSRAVVLPVRALLTRKATTKQQVQKNGTTSTKKQGAKYPFQLGFTKENELFVGRLAMLGFAFSLIGELLTGRGALSQLGYEVFDDKLNIVQIDELVVGLILFNLVCAILPASGTFVPDEEVEARVGPLQDPRIYPTDVKRFFGVSEFGFTKENELFVGRMAQLGFAASLIGETITGKGPLAQFDIETGISLQDTEFGLAVFILFFLFAAINPGTGKFVNEDK